MGGKGKTGLPDTRISASDTTPVGQVFDAWVTSCGHTGRTRLDAKRRGLILKALAGYPLEDVLDAVRGWQHSAFHRGENDASKVYNDLGLLLRDASHIEEFRDRWRSPSELSRSESLTNTRSVVHNNRDAWEQARDEILAEAQE